MNSRPGGGACISLHNCFSRNRPNGAAAQRHNGAMAEKNEEGLTTLDARRSTQDARRWEEEEEVAGFE
jgi:hypothetical protein